MNSGFFRDTSTKLLVLVFIFGVFGTAEAAPYLFSRNLKVGMVGEDVKQLQMYLNSDIDTSIRTSGTGSRGLESTYFGNLTKDAVIRFQEKYREAILTPNNLVSGTGFVGFATRLELNRQVVAKEKANALTQSASSAKKVELVSTGPTKVPPEQANNPNFQNYDLFLAALDMQAKKTNMSDESLVKFKEQATKDLATTTNLREKFFSQMTSQAVLELEKGSLFGNIMLKLAQGLEKTFQPKDALAFTTRDFGGKLIFPFYCTCSYNWLVVMMPMAPDYVFALSYTPYTQQFSNYNMPYAAEFLGKYDPSQGQCSIYYGYGCYTMYTEGTITSTVGSSMY